MIGIIGFNSIKLMQFLNKYTDVLEKYNINYEVIFWNRDNVNLNTPENYISFNCKIDTYKSFFEKLFLFLKYTKFLYWKIKSRRYKKLIFLTTQTIIPLLPWALGKYKNKYIFDYRDITFERYYFYKLIVQKLISNSAITAISSKGFIDILGPSDRFVMSHNCYAFQFDSILHPKRKKINIVYWGMIRQIEYNKKICDLFGNDDRFCLKYHGEGFYKELQLYCKTKGYYNVVFTGTYNVKDIVKFAKDTDILMNTYENDEQQRLAITVKFYDAIKYSLPQIVTRNSYMSEVVEKEKLGISIDIDEFNLANIIYIWYKRIDYIDLYNSYKNYMQKIIKDDLKFEKNIMDFVNMKT